MLNHIHQILYAPEQSPPRHNHQAITMDQGTRATPAESSSRHLATIETIQLSMKE
jgi:hypothetical protein